MRNILSLLLIGAVTLTSCKKYLDVNQNPNRATVSTPEVVLPQALTHTASNAVIFHDYGSWQAGYFANAGGYGGWGSTITYNYASNDYNTLWNETYDNLQDYQYVIEQTMGKDEYSYYNAAARIMKSYNFMLLVDNYNDVPYKDALKGIGNTTPAY